MNFSVLLLLQFCDDKVRWKQASISIENVFEHVVDTQKLS